MPQQKQADQPRRATVRKKFMLGWVAKNAVISKDHTLRITATAANPFSPMLILVEGPVQVRLRFARQRMGKGVCNGTKDQEGFLRPASRELSSMAANGANWLCR